MTGPPHHHSLAPVSEVVLKMYPGQIHVRATRKTLKKEIVMLQDQGPGEMMRVTKQE